MPSFFLFLSCYKKLLGGIEIIHYTGYHVVKVAYCTAHYRTGTELLLLCTGHFVVEMLDYP